MKKNRFKSLLLAIAFIISNTIVFAQGWQDWDWKDYNITFAIPRNFKVKESSATRFVADDGRDITIVIKPWKDPNVNERDVANRGYNEVNAVQKTILEQEPVELDSGGLKAYMIYGRGKQGNKWLYFGVVGYIDPNSDVNIYYMAMWWDKPNDNDRLMNLAADIAKTLKKR